MTLMKLPHGRDMFHGKIKDDFSMITVDSTTADNHNSTLGPCTNDLVDDIGPHTKALLWPSRGSFWIVWQLH